MEGPVACKQHKIKDRNQETLHNESDLRQLSYNLSYYIYIYIIGNQEKFRNNSSVHSINTRNKHYLHRLVANLSCFQKGASYSGITIFNNLPWSNTGLKNEKIQFKVVLKKFLYAPSFYYVDEIFAYQMICITDLYDCVNPYTVIFLYVCMFMTCSTSYCLVTVLRMQGMYVQCQRQPTTSQNNCQNTFPFHQHVPFNCHKIFKDHSIYFDRLKFSYNFIYVW